MVSVEQAIRDRYSCRRFLSRPVPRETLEAILALAQQTPSWCNTQPWQLLVVEGEELKRLSEGLYRHAAQGSAPNPDFDFPARYEGIYRERRKICGVQLYQSIGIGRDDRGAAAAQSLENFRCFGAPHLILITTPADLGVYGAIDCGVYVAHLMLAARAHGVDSIAQAALASYPDLLRAHFGLPPERRFVCGVALGYGDIAHPINRYRTGRAGLADAIDWRA